MAHNDILRNSEARLSEVLKIDHHGEGLPTGKSAVSPSPGGKEMGDGPEDIYNMAYDGEVPNLWSLKYIGIIANYFAVGVVYGGSVNMLYPVLLLKNGEEPAFYSAAASMVTIFWAYKIFFGIVSDCFPIFGWKRKPYIFGGWLLCGLLLAILTFQGSDVNSFTLVIFLVLANFGYVMAVVAADGFVVWLAHREPIETRGQAQSMIYISREAGRVISAVVVGLFLSGPNVTCPGYQKDESIPCTDDVEVLARTEYWNATTKAVTQPDWCYQQCSQAALSFGLSIPATIWIMAGITLLSVPFYIFLFEEKTVRESFTKKMTSFWYIMQKRAVWQVVLYTIVSNIFGNVSVNAKSNTLDIWLGLSTLMNSLLSIFESMLFFGGLLLYKYYFINTSWRKMLVVTFFIAKFFNALYFLIVYDVIRNQWLYAFMDVSETFIAAANFLASVYYIVEVSEPGYEAITYALITTSNNMINPLTTVVSNQLSGLFALSNADLYRDDIAVHNEYLYNYLLCTAINLVSLLTLFLLPPQKKEARELLAKGDQSKGWALTVLIAGIVCLVYSTIVSFLTLVPEQKCHKIFGGRGCKDAAGKIIPESNVPSILLILIVNLFAIVAPAMVWYQYIRKK